MTTIEAEVHNLHSPLAPVVTDKSTQTPAPQPDAPPFALPLGPLKVVHAFWLAGMSCDSCSIAAVGATQPSVEQLITGSIPGVPKVILHHPVLAVTAGEEFVHNFELAANDELDAPLWSSLKARWRMEQGDQTQARQTELARPLHLGHCSHLGSDADGGWRLRSTLFDCQGAGVAHQSLFRGDRPQHEDRRSRWYVAQCTVRMACAREMERL